MGFVLLLIDVTGKIFVVVVSCAVFALVVVVAVVLVGRDVPALKEGRQQGGLIYIERKLINNIKK